MPFIICVSSTGVILPLIVWSLFIYRSLYISYMQWFSFILILRALDSHCSAHVFEDRLFISKNAARGIWMCVIFEETVHAVLEAVFFKHFSARGIQQILPIKAYGQYCAPCCINCAPGFKIASTLAIMNHRIVAMFDVGLRFHSLFKHLKQW